MSVALSVFLSDEELSQVADDVKQKLEKEFSIKESSLDSLKVQLEKVKGDYEQKCYEMDKKIIEMSAQLDVETSSCRKATDRSKELEDALKSSKEKCEELEGNFAESQREVSALKHTQDVWKDEKLSLQHLIETRDLELKDLKGEWKAMSDKLATATASKNEIELKLDELQNSGVTVQYHNKRLEHEKELLTQQNEQLSEELKVKSTELYSYKLNKENELVSLRSKLEIKMDECNQSNNITENLRVSNENLEKKVATLLEKGNAADEERQSMEELYRNELQSQTNLAELYKSSAKDGEDKAKQLESAVQELQRLLSRSADVEKKAQSETEEWKNKAQEMKYEIESLKKELENANDLLVAKKREGPQNLTEEELAALCPTAAMASKFIKSGMTLTEMYTKYVDTLDELEIAKHESKRMSDAMDAILEELNEKAPILRQQKEDYERALATITQLTSQMDAVAIDSQRLRAEADDANRKLGRVEREKKRLQSESVDLSTQVKFLLKELEESRGQNVSMDSKMEDDANVSSSSEVITGHLVTFKNIEELQEQNKRLLQVVRELGEENEKRDNESDEMKQLRETLNQAKEELDSLREDRTKQMEYVEMIVRQRDMYRVLLSQEPQNSIPLSIISSPSLLASNKEAGDAGRGVSKEKPREDSSEALKVLKQEFDEYKSEVQGNNKVMNEQTDSLRSQISELRADNVKLQTNLDFSNENYNLLKQRFEGVSKEVEMYRDKNAKLVAMIQKHEINFNGVSNDLMVCKQEKGRLEAKIDNLTSEIDILHRAEERLKSENSSLQRDQRGQSVLLANLQKIQLSMEKQEFEVRSELRNRIEAQERELTALRKTNSDILQQKQATMQIIEKQLLSAQQNLEQTRSAKESISLELQKKEEELEKSKLENQSNISKLLVLEQRLSRIAGGSAVETSLGESSGEDMKEAKQKCKELEDEVVTLKSKLERMQRAVQQHKDCATAAEESLKQANEANRELSEAFEARLKNASEHQTKLEQRITVLEDENRQLNSKRTSLINEVDLRTADLNRQLASLQGELDMVLKREKDLKKSEQEARNQYQEQANHINEAQNKYQREMLLHAESVKQIMELKEASKNSTEIIENLKAEAAQAKHLLDSSKGMWEKQRTKLEQENEEMTERNSDMRGQMAALHSQLEEMSTQVVALQQKQITSPIAKYSKFASHTDVAAASTEDPNGKSQEQLMDIIKFLRKEKNLHEVKYEVAQSENNRLKQQLIHLQKQADEAKKVLLDEQHKSRATSSELAKHEALMKKVETLNVLSDSNRMLRDEKERLENDLQNAKTSLAEIKEKYTPLLAEKNQLSTQYDTLKAQKTALEQDVQRWQQRSQQLLQSPKRQDPEEYRKLIGEKQKLSQANDQLNKELTEKKLEISNLQGDIRNLNQETETLRSTSATTSKKVETLEAELKTKQADIDEKTKNVAQLKRVGRKYKQQCEELQKKQQEMESNQTKLLAEKASNISAQESSAASEAAIAELNAKVSALEASLAKSAKEKDDNQQALQQLQQQMAMKSAENDALKSQLQHSNQKLEEENKGGTSELAQENNKLKLELDEMKKQMQEKEEKSKRLLTLAKNRIEQVRREKDELSSERDQLKNTEQESSRTLENMKQAIKRETDTKLELQAKIEELQRRQAKLEELQRQLSNTSSQQQQQNKVNSVVGQQIHPHAGSSSGVELRKAVNIRPISTQRVSQVSPIRVTRTARVMPEPQQEAQESSSSDALPARSSTHTASSSHHSAPISGVSTSAGTPVTRAFVHPITPSSARHPHVVSSTPTSSAIPHTSNQSDSSQVDTAVTRGNTSSSTDVVSPEAVPYSAGSVVASDASESDQAIVSSSDDQTTQVDDSQQQPSTSGGNKTTSSDVASETEDGPSQSASSSGDPSVSASTIPVLLGRRAQSAQKRTYEDLSETNSTTDENPASSSDAQVSVPPISKRQRSSPDQSSAAVQPLTSEASMSESTSQSAEPGSSSPTRDGMEAKPSSEQAADTQSASQHHDTNVDTSTFTPISEIEPSGSEIQSMPTSSGAGEVIVLSSDEEDSQPENINVGQDQDEPYAEGEEIMDASEGGENESEEIPQSHSYSSARPILELPHATPPDISRTRAMGRPAPLTPGLVPAAADDGDGIVPCTPTLPTRRHDDYQAINSPHVPAGGPPIRFQFENVSVPSQSQSGLYSVDNTIMDFSDAARSVPTTPIPVASVTTVTHVILDPPQSAQAEAAAVSSSIMEEGEIVEEDKDDAGGEMCVPISSSSQEESNVAGNVQSEQQGTVSNLQNIRGRKIKLIGGRSRGKGGSSPSTSNQ